MRVLDSDTGKLLFEFGKRGDRPGEFNLPRDAVVGPDGLGYVVDGGNFRIQVFDTDGKFVKTFGAIGLQSGQFSRPNEIAADTLGTTSLDGKVAPVGSVSIACLSCHDGVTSMSAVINAPGSGTAGDAAWRAGAWSGTNQGGGILTLATAGITSIGTDLRNDHPIGIQYGGGGIKVSTPVAATTGPDFKAPKNALVNGTTVWWVDTEATPNGTRQKTDMMLYTRVAAAGYTAQAEPEPFVECASCHDPHTSNSTSVFSVNSRPMRRRASA